MAAYGEVVGEDVAMRAEGRVRERLGTHACNRRRDVAVLKREFGEVDFGGMQEGRDREWEGCVWEGPEVIAERAWGFWEELVEKGGVSVVVAHTGFFKAALALCFGEDGSFVRQPLAGSWLFFVKCADIFVGMSTLSCYVCFVCCTKGDPRARRDHLRRER